MRKEVNELDNLTTGKAVDVLLNYETVKLFNNEQLEVDQYDAYLLGFQVTFCCCRSSIAIPFLHHNHAWGMLLDLSCPPGLPTPLALFQWAGRTTCSTPSLIHPSIHPSSSMESIHSMRSASQRYRTCCIFCHLPTSCHNVIVTLAQTACGNN